MPDWFASANPARQPSCCFTSSREEVATVRYYEAKELRAVSERSAVFAAFYQFNSCQNLLLGF